jgi:phthalate 4,5-dioxygenase oxygenase subunit
MTDQLTHVRVTNAIFPATFVIPLSETMTITQMHVPVDDTHTYWYSFFTSFAGPLDKEAMRAQRQQFISLPTTSRSPGRHNHWGFNPEEQMSTTYLGMGEEDINVHDQWAVESMGAIQDRTREHLGTSDKIIMANRRVLLKAIETVQAGGMPPGIADPAIAAASQRPRHGGRRGTRGRLGRLVARTGTGQARKGARGSRQQARKKPGKAPA